MLRAAALVSHDKEKLFVFWTVFESETRRQRAQAHPAQIEPNRDKISGDKIRLSKSSQRLQIEPESAKLSNLSQNGNKAKPIVLYKIRHAG